MARAGRWMAIAALAFVAANAARAEEPDLPWPPSPESLTDADVEAGIRAISAELQARRDPVHGWDPARWTASWGSTSQRGGYTAIVLLSLVESGTPASTPGIRDAIRQLASAPIEGMYARSARIMLGTRLPPGTMPVEDDIRRLLESMDVDRGSWGYREGDRGRRDNSIRQFGALALWAAERAGHSIPFAAWHSIETALLAAQRPDGGWNYTENEAPSRGSMTAAAVATLLVAESRAPVPDPRSEARREAMDRGLAWLHRNFDPKANPGSRSWRSYWAYSIERVGLAAGLVRFAGRDWFREMAADTLDRCCRRDGSGAIVVRRDRNPRSVDLAFSLLLLARGRVPVTIGKLAIPGTCTDARPRDVAGVARLVGRTLETDLGWRRTEPSDDPGVWNQVPLLFITGDRPIDENVAGDALAGRLTDYLASGGTLVVVDTGRGTLSRQMHRLLETAIGPVTRSRLAADHPLRSAHRSVRGGGRIEVVRHAGRDVAVFLRGMEWLPNAAPKSGSRTARRAGPGTHEAILVNMVIAATADRPMSPRLAVISPSIAPDTNRPGPAGPRIAFDVGVEPASARAIANAAYEALRAWWDPATDGPVPVENARIDPVPDDPGLLVVSSPAAPDDTIDGFMARIARATDAGWIVLVADLGGRAAESPGFARRVGATLRSDGWVDAPGVARAITDTAPRNIANVHWTSVLRARRGARPSKLPLRALRSPDGRGTVLLLDEDVVHGLIGGGSWSVRGLSTESARRVVAAILRHVSEDR